MNELTEVYCITCRADMNLTDGIRCMVDGHVVFTEPKVTA